MRIIHNVNYDVSSQLEFRKIIYQNIVKVLNTLYFYDLSSKLGDESAGGRTEEVEDSPE